MFRLQQGGYCSEHREIITPLSESSSGHPARPKSVEAEIQAHISIALLQADALHLHTAHGWVHMGCYIPCTQVFIMLYLACDGGMIQWSIGLSFAITVHHLNFSRQQG